MGMLRKVLIVDDHQINRKVLTNILDTNYEILTAENGQIALEILREQGKQISAVLLDVVMPVMDGYQVLEQVRQDPVLSTIPILVTSYKSGDESELKALNLGARDFVSKPYNPEILKKRLWNLIQMQEATETIDVLEKDSMTGLYTKQVFCRKFYELKQQNPEKKYDIIAIDIMNLKLVNDTYGFMEGTRLIQHMGESIKRQIGDSGGFACRAYADQFFLFVDREAQNEKDILNHIRADMKAYPMDMKMHARFGVYHVEDGIDVPVSVMCERAMFSVDSIRGQVQKDIAYYDDSVRTKLLLEQQISDEMADALTNQEFQVYLQPKYCISTGKMAGAEALVRWISPKRGFMSPGMFIPLFEKNGFITELDLYIWDKTAEMIANWLKEGNKYVPVSVNVSRKDIYRRDLVKNLKKIIKRHGLEPKHLHLEITESAYTENQDQIIETVNKLKEEGFEIEMDDFGSGYSSLNMLSRLPIDILKLDMKFVQSMCEESKSVSILGSTIQLAKRIELKVVAEGVEEEKQYEILRDMDCDMIQGYYFAKPMPEPEFRELLYKD